MVANARVHDARYVVISWGLEARALNGVRVVSLVKVNRRVTQVVYREGTRSVVDDDGVRPLR